MRIVKFVTAISCLLLVVHAKGQRPVPSGKMNGIIDLNQYGDWYMNVMNSIERQTRKDTSDLKFVIVELSDASVSTELLREKFGGRIKQETYTLKLPSQQEKYSAILWYLEQTQPKPIIHITVIKAITSTSFQFYVDRNNNKNFTDDGPPFEFKNSKHKFESFTINEPSLTRPFELVIINPGNGQPQVQSSTKIIPVEQRVDMEEYTLPRPFKVFFGAHINTGSGHADLQFDNDQQAHISYNSKIAGCARLDLDVGISFKGLNLYINGGAEYIQMGVRMRHIQSRHSYQNGTKSSLGFFPDQKVHYGFGLGYDIKLVKQLYIGPFVQLNKFHYQSVDKLFDEYTYKDVDLVHMNRSFNQGARSISYGIRLKVAPVNDVRIVIEALRRRYYFDASNYFPDLVPGSYQLDYKLFYFGLGVEVNLYDF